MVQGNGKPAESGDTLSVHATYDTSKASWYEVMGIMVVGITDHQVPGGVDPFSGKVDQTDTLTHPRLKENVDAGVGRVSRNSTGLRQQGAGHGVHSRHRP